MTLVVAWRVAEDDGQLSIGMAADRMYTVPRCRHREGGKITTLVGEDGRTLGFIAAAGLLTSHIPFTRHFAEEMKKINERDLTLETFEEAARRTYLSALRELRDVDPSVKNIGCSILVVARLGVAEVMSGGNLLWTVDLGGVVYEAVGTGDDYALGYLDARFSDDDFDVVDSVRNLMELVPSRFADTVGCGFDLKTHTTSLGYR